ncbi:hypothetical protein ACLOJK_041064 [Asimina triloba]
MDACVHGLHGKREKLSFDFAEYGVTYCEDQESTLEILSVEEEYGKKIRVSGHLKAGSLRVPSHRLGHKGWQRRGLTEWYQSKFRQELVDRATPVERQARLAVPASRSSQGILVMVIQEQIKAKASNVQVAPQATSTPRGGDRVDIVLELVVDMLHDMREFMAEQGRA